MRQVCEYEAFDGTRFKNPIECKKYENYINYCGEVGKVIKAHLFGFSAEYMRGNDKSNLIKQFIEITEGVYDGFCFVFRLETLPELKNENT